MVEKQESLGSMQDGLPQFSDEVDPKQLIKQGKLRILLVSDLHLSFDFIKKL